MAWVKATRILFIDNDVTHETANLLTSIVSKRLSRPVVFDCGSDAFEALSLLDRIHYDLVFIARALHYFGNDTVFKSSSHEAADEIVVALRERGATCRVVRVTTNRRASGVVEPNAGKNLNEDSTIEKPFSVDTLCDVIENQCEVTAQALADLGTHAPTDTARGSAELFLLLASTTTDEDQEQQHSNLPTTLRDPSPARFGLTRVFSRERLHPTNIAAGWEAGIGVDVASVC